MSAAGWVTTLFCVLGTYFMVLAKIKQKSRAEMNPEEMKIFLRGYLLFILGGSLGIVLGLTYCMPYFT